MLILWWISVPSYRYIKSRYKRVYIKRELFEKLQALADREGLTVPSLIEKLYSMYITPNIGDNIQHNITPNTDSQSPTMSITPNIQHNITPNTVQDKTITKCYEKSKMKYPVESNIAYFKSKGVLVDWWEEGDDRVCFELKTDAGSGTTTGQHRKKHYKRRSEDEDESWLLEYVPEDWEK
jgi:hypothetical protein